MSKTQTVAATVRILPWGGVETRVIALSANADRYIATVVVFYPEGNKASVNHRHEYVMRNGVPHWLSNDSVPYLTDIEANGMDATPGFDRTRTVAERAEQDNSFLAEYRARGPRVISDEERFEARAAHGAGVELVDVLSGQRWTT